MAKTSPQYELMSKWRNGWQLIKLGDQYYLRRMMRGQFKVNAVRDGLVWHITDPANNNQRVQVELLK